MKKSLLFLICSLLASVAVVSAEGTITILDNVYKVDTVAHLKVGPGTTTTHLLLTGPNKLQAHYLTIDKTAPGVDIHAVCGTDKVAGTERTSSMAKRKSTKNRIYFAGTNADFFTTTGFATNGSSKVGSPTTSCTVDGEIYKTSNSQYQFSYDKDGIARICRLNYYTGTATMGEKTTLFKGVNVASPNNGITIYTSKYWGSTNQNDKAGSCNEVTAKLVEGDSFTAGGTFRLEVTSTPTTDGDTKIPEGEFVIHGRGTSTTGCNTGSNDFVAALVPGDIVTFDNIILAGDERIYPMQIVSGNPKNVGAGVTLDSEGERTDAVQLHPRTGIGVSEDGNTIIMMVVEGRYDGSAGVRTSQLADIMRYAGAYEAVNLDGGGSSTLYTQAFGVRNYCSDGNERAVGNGIFATVDIPEEDNEISEVRFADWHKRLPKYGSYTPRLMGYNKYGLLVNDSITSYTLTCPEAMGVIIDGITLYSNGEGTHALTAKIGDITVSIPVTVDKNFSFKPRLTNILTDNRREYTVELYASDGIKSVKVDPMALNWSSSDSEIATVRETGVIKGVSDGTATITGSVDGNQTEITVNVEVPKANKTNIFANFDPSEWDFSKVGCDANTAMTHTDAGVEFAYKVTSSRSSKMTITAKEHIRLWSLPSGIQIKSDIEGADINSLTINYTNGKGERFSSRNENIAVGNGQVVDIKFSDYFNTEDLIYYPIKLTSFVLGLQPKSGVTGKITISEFNIIYNGESGAVEIVGKDSDGNNSKTEYYDLQGIKVTNPSTGLYIVRQGNKAEKKLIR